VSAALDPERAYAQTAGATALPINLELVTVTETSMVVTWFTGDPTQVDSMGRLAPVPADTELLLGTSPSSLATVFHESAPTPYHYVEITGLQPEQTYFFIARSGGLPAVPATTFVVTRQLPYAFTTPAPPPGRFLFAIALSNDMHIGETVAGLATTQAGVGLPPGVSQVDGRPPYPEVMAAALASEPRARGANLLLVDGDVTSDARPAEISTAKAFLDRFGAYRTDYFVTRGNHDRHHEGSPDTFASTFFPAAPTWYALEAFGLRVLGLDTYDKIGSGGDNGVLGDAQWAHVREELARDKDRPTLVLGHHPVTTEATLTTVPPVTFDMDRAQAAQLEQLYAATPGVFLHHSGHTHRNKRTSSSTAPRVVFQESGAVKEYPGGYTMLRVFSGGYALNFYKFKSPLALEWSERSRPEYLGQAPLYYFGSAVDRNSVVMRDFSGLAAAPVAVPRTSASPAGPATERARVQSDELAATGGTPIPVAAALATAALGLAAGAAGRAGVPCQNGVISNTANNANTARAANVSPNGENSAGRSTGPSSSE
jgi:hypothetical protein